MRRVHVEMIYDCVRVVSAMPRCLERIIRVANVDYSFFKNVVLPKGFLEPVSSGHGGKYKLSKKGVAFFLCYNHLLRLLDAETTQTET